jgi:DNA polymerase elongation subunit (family B)
MIIKIYLWLPEKLPVYRVATMPPLNFGTTQDEVDNELKKTTYEYFPTGIIAYRGDRMLWQYKIKRRSK